MRQATVVLSIMAIVLLSVISSAQPAFAQRSREQCREMADSSALHGGTGGARGARDRYMRRCMRGDRNPHGGKGMGGGGMGGMGGGGMGGMGGGGM
jgi:hypothetical protein